MLQRIRNKNGVTLVELILVIAVVGIIMAAALAFFLFGTRTFTLGSNQAKVQQEARLATTIVSQDLRTAIGVKAYIDGATIDPAPLSTEYIVKRVGTSPGPYSLQYIRPSGTLETDDIFTSLSFSISKNTTTGKYFVIFQATGSENGRDYTINSTMLLENDQSLLNIGSDYVTLVFTK